MRLAGARVVIAGRARRLRQCVDARSCAALCWWTTAPPSAWASTRPDTARARRPSSQLVKRPGKDSEPSNPASARVSSCAPITAAPSFSDVFQQEIALLSLESSASSGGRHGWINPADQRRPAHWREDYGMKTINALSRNRAPLHLRQRRPSTDPSLEREHRDLNLPVGSSGGEAVLCQPPERVANIVVVELLQARFTDKRRNVLDDGDAVILPNRRPHRLRDQGRLTPWA